jgi:hypothetical protein
MADMEIKVGADVGGAIAGLNQVQTELNQTGKAAQQLGESVNSASTKFKQLPSVTNQATFTLNNFNRVVQDAPFGIRGIANNIDPLIESFLQLKSTTQSTGGAFAALGKTLLGPAGIALAVSTVTSLLIQYGDKLFSSSAAAKDAEESSKKLAAALAEELVQLATIVGLAQNVNASQSDRVKAIQLLNQEYGKYLSNLGTESITLTNINDKYQQLIDTMLRQAVVKGLQEEISNQVAETAKRIIQLQIAREKERIEIANSNKVKNDSLLIDQKLKQIADQKNKAISDGVIAYQKQTQAESAAIGTTNVYDMMISGLKDELIKTLAPTLKLASAFNDLDKKLKPQKLEEFDWTPIMGIGPFAEELARQAAMFEMGIVTRAYEKRIKEGFKKLKEVKIPFRISAEVKAEQQNFEKLQKSFQERFQALADSLNAVLTPAFQGFFDALQNGTNVIDGFFNGLVQGIKQLFQQLAKTAAIAGLLTLLFPGSSFGANLKLVSGFGGFGGQRANGGPVSGNTPYLVGERGPELFVPSVSGSIVPNNSVGSFMGGGMSGGGRSSVLRGQDILLAYARTQRSQLRVNG